MHAYVHFYMHDVIHVYMHVFNFKKLLKEKSCDCRHVLSLSLYEIESLFVQRTNEGPYPSQFPVSHEGLVCGGVILRDNLSSHLHQKYHSCQRGVTSSASVVIFHIIMTKQT